MGSESLKLIPVSEHEIHCSVIEHLKLRVVPGCFAWHTPNGGYRTKAEAGLFKRMGVIAGVPDVLALRSGHLFGLELKRRNGRLSPEQIAVHEQMRKAGADICTVYDVDEALDQLAGWGLLR